MERDTPFGTLKNSWEWKYRGQTDRQTRSGDLKKFEQMRNSWKRTGRRRKRKRYPICDNFFLPSLPPSLTLSYFLSFPALYLTHEVFQAQGWVSLHLSPLSPTPLSLQFFHLKIWASSISRKSGLCTMKYRTKNFSKFFRRDLDFFDDWSLFEIY